MEQLPQTASPIWESGTRHNLFLGGDREVVMGCGLASSGLALFGQSIASIALAAALWSSTLLLARMAARKDPLYFRVVFRAVRYRSYYPARRTPFRKLVSAKRWYR